MEQIRAFIAIQLPAALRDALREILRELKRAESANAVRWVAPENIHLTLKFLGMLDAARLPEWRDALEQGARGIPAFTLTARGIGCFPNTQRPNNVWVGIGGDVAAAQKLAQQMDHAFAARGIARAARPFTPHLTLGRVKRETQPRERAAFGKVVEQFPPRELGMITVDAVHLIQSDLRPSGPEYSVLRTAQLE